jgi:hypothetical protein
VRQRIRRATDGLGWAIGVAAGLLIFALLSFLLIIQSRNDWLLWSGARVVGDERQGLVFYSLHGQHETLDVKGSANNPHYIVYVNKSDPTDAVPEAWTIRTVDLVMVPGPVVLAGFALSVGIARRRRQRRRPADAAGFGQGLDPDFVQRKLDELRGNDWQR